MATTKQGTDQILTRAEDGIFHIQLNRPEKKNALTQAMYQGIAMAVQEAEQDDSIRVIHITGTDDCFCAGNDVLDFKSVKEKADAGESRAPEGLNMIGVMMEAKKPIVASVTGYAIGIGVTLLLHCDLVYAAASAIFRLPFVNLGLCPEAGSSYLIPRISGYQRAAELILLGDKFDAQTAREAGIVNAVYPDDELAAAVAAKARQLAQQPPASMRISKALLKRGYANAVHEAMGAESQQLVPLLVAPEAVEAFAAFAQRREPDFSQFT